MMRTRISYNQGETILATSSRRRGAGVADTSSRHRIIPREEIFVNCLSKDHYRDVH